MKIKLVSNRKFILYIAIPFAVMYCLVIIYMIVVQIAGLFNIYDEPIPFISSVFFLLCLVAVIIYTKYHIGPSFLFTDTYIYIYKKNDLIIKIDVANIEYMHYYPYRFHYFITILFGALMEGGAMKIHKKRTMEPPTNWDS